jgi:hypothetical protein
MNVKDVYQIIMAIVGMSGLIALAIVLMLLTGIFV